MPYRSALILVFCLSSAAQKPTFDQLAELVRSRSPKLAEALPAALGAEEIRKGTAVAAQGGDFIFAIDSAAEPLLIIDDHISLRMTRIEGTNLWYRHSLVKTGTTHNFHYMRNQERFGGRMDVAAFGPYSYAKPGVVQGKLSEKMVHTSKIYPDMKSDYWVWTPAQYNALTPA